MAQPTVKLLDCTLRDGGYILGWNHTVEQVNMLVSCLGRAGVAWCELGFINCPTSGSHPWESITLDLIESLIPSPVVQFAAMVDYGKSDLARVSPWPAALNMLRVAVVPQDIDGAIKFASSLCCYPLRSVAINLMRLSTIKLSDLSRIVKRLAGSVDVLYLADSYGACYPNQVRDAVSLCCDLLWPHGVQVGFHAHNNLQLAFANSLAAVKAGAEWVDCTVAGVGRGAGNLPTELAVGHWCGPQYVADVLAYRTAYLAGREEKWGYNARNLMTGLTNVHPTKSISCEK